MNVVIKKIVSNLLSRVNNFSAGNSFNRSGLSLIFQVDGELKKVAGRQKKSSAAAELAGGCSRGLGFEKITLANIGVTEKS